MDDTVETIPVGPTTPSATVSAHSSYSYDERTTATPSSSSDASSGTALDFFMSFGLSFLFFIPGAVAAFFLMRHRKSKLMKFGMAYGCGLDLFLAFFMSHVVLAFPVYSLSVSVDEHKSRVVASEVMAFFSFVVAMVLVAIAGWSHMFWMDEGEPRTQTFGTTRDGLLAGITSFCLVLGAPLLTPILPFGRSVFGKLWTCIGATVGTLFVGSAIIRAGIVNNECLFCANGSSLDKCPGSGSYSSAIFAAFFVIGAVGYFIIAFPSYLADFRLHERKQFIR